jgi:hypothetical protein
MNTSIVSSVVSSVSSNAVQEAGGTFVSVLMMSAAMVYGLIAVGVVVVVLSIVIPVVVHFKKKDKKAKFRGKDPRRAKK